MKQLMKDGSGSLIPDHMTELDKFYIYGAGFVGLHVCDLLMSAGWVPSGIIDGNERLKGSFWQDVEVISPSDADKDALVVVCHSSVRVCYDIEQRLRNFGFHRVERIYTFADHPELRGVFRDQRIVFFVDTTEIHDHASDIETVENLLSDEKSRATYRQIINALETKSFSGISCEQITEQYFPKDIYIRRNDEIFIDIGAGPDWDVLEAFLVLYGNDFARYYAVEPCSYQKKHITHAENPKIFYISKAAGRSESSVWIREYMGKNALILDKAEQKSELFLIDQVSWSMGMTYLKIDVEGYERNVLEGAQKRIREYRPVIAIAVYHSVRDFWEIPLLLESLLTNYCYYLRSYQGVSETILYAVPYERKHSI